MEVTPLDSDKHVGAGEEVTARQVEPGGLEELWWEVYKFINIKILISSISAFSEA